MAGLFGAPVNLYAAQPSLADVPDVDLVSPPPESISTIAFSPVADHLAVGSWGPDVRFLALGALQLLPCLGQTHEDVRFLISFLFFWDVGGAQVRIYDVGLQGQSQGKALAPHPGTVLDLCWNKVRTASVSSFSHDLAISITR